MFAQTSARHMCAGLLKRARPRLCMIICWINPMKVHTLCSCVWEGWVCMDNMAECSICDRLVGKPVCDICSYMCARYCACVHVCTGVQPSENHSQTVWSSSEWCGGAVAYLWFWQGALKRDHGWLSACVVGKAKTRCARTQCVQCTKSCKANSTNTNYLYS